MCSSPQFRCRLLQRRSLPHPTGMLPNSYIPSCHRPVQIQSQSRTRPWVTKFAHKQPPGVLRALLLPRPQGPTPQPLSWLPTTAAPNAGLAPLQTPWPPSYCASKARSCPLALGLLLHTRRLRRPGCQEYSRSRFNVHGICMTNPEAR
jgi:hypothetical protein